MFRFFKKKAAPAPPASAPAVALADESAAASELADQPASSDLAAPPPTPAPAARDVAAEIDFPDVPPPAVAPSDAPPADALPAVEPRRSWTERLRSGLRKTGSSIANVFTTTRIDDALYEELETALLMADTGVAASEHLLTDLKRRVKADRATDPQAVKGLLADAIAELLAPLEGELAVGQEAPTVIMVVGVNGAGKTTSIGKLTRHLAQAGCKVLQRLRQHVDAA